MPNDLQLSDQDEVLLESLVLAASDNVARAPASDRDQFAPERRRAFVETSGNENVYLGTGSTWVDVSENTGLLSKLFSGGDGNFDSVNTDRSFNGDDELIARVFEADDGDAVAHGRGGRIAKDPDPGVVINAAIQDIPNWTNAGGEIRIMDFLTGVSTQISFPGTGYFDEDYVAISLTAGNLGAGLRMADGANLTPMIGLEHGENNAPHRHIISNLLLRGNNGNNTSGTAIAGTEVTRSGNVLEPLLRGNWIIEWQDTAVDLTQTFVPTVVGGAIAYNISGDLVTVGESKVRGLEVHDGAGDNLVVSGDTANITNVRSYNAGNNNLTITADSCIISGAVLFNAQNINLAVTGNYNNLHAVIDGKNNTKNGVLISGGEGNVAWVNSRQNTGDDYSADELNLINGVGAETANAEQPQFDWPTGATVNFTDSGDGSGTAVYQQLLDGSWFAT